VPEREDPFADLGGGEEKSRAEQIGDALAERDRVDPEPAARPPEIPRPSSRYAWLVGIVLFMGIVILLITTALPNSGEGFRGPKRGTLMPEFAAPLVTSNLEGDANIRQRRFGSSSQGRVPACDIHSRDVLNSCDLRKRPVVLTFVFDRGADCYPQVDRVERMRRSVPGVSFVVVFFSRKDRDELRTIVSRRGWDMPVGVDHDGQVANLYGVGGCPTTVFARKGGRVARTLLGNRTEDELRAVARRLVAR
jgi:peroxiredoxin